LIAARVLHVESDATATLNQPDDEDDQRQDQQDVKQSTHRMGSEQSHYPQHQEKHRQGPQHCATSLSRRDTLPCRRIAAPDWAFDGSGVTTVLNSAYLSLLSFVPTFFLTARVSRSIGRIGPWDGRALF